MYLLDTNVLSELRKRESGNSGVRKFFDRLIQEGAHVYVSVITIGELRLGVELIRYRGDVVQARELEAWLGVLLDEYHDYILDIDSEVTQLWGRLRVPHHENALDKLIAATAIINDLTVVTRNTKGFRSTGAKILDPFD